MRRTFNLVLAAIVVLAITALPLTATAGQTCGSVKAKLGSIADKSACTASTLAGAKTVSWDCDYEGKCETVHISIDGMTCGSCENTLTTVLSGLEGVVKVHKISHEDGMAVVCCDPTKIKGEPVQVRAEKCTACQSCMNLGCPAITWSDEMYDGQHKVQIDPVNCIGCSICTQVCPVDGIRPVVN